MIRCASDIMKEARSRGLRIRINRGPPPMPEVIGPEEEKTPALLDALRAFRLDIIDEIASENERMTE